MNIDIQIIQFIVIISFMVLFFVLEIIPMEVTALATLGAFWLLEILTIEEAISGFGNKAVITIGAIFIIRHATTTGPSPHI